MTTDEEPKPYFKDAWCKGPTARLYGADVLTRLK